MKITILVYALILLTLPGCDHTEKKDAPFAGNANSFVILPVKKINVPFKENTVAAAKGDTLFYPTGSIILFPP